MKCLRENKKLDKLKLTPLQKRILITKAVAETHHSLARSGAFKRAFIATGTWMPSEHSAEEEVSLQGVRIDYMALCNKAAIENHKKKLDSLEAERTAKMLEAKRLAEEERRSQAQIFEPAVVKSKMLWPTV